MSTTYTTIESPVGPLLLAAGDDGLHAIEFHASRHPVRRGADWQQGHHPLLDRAREQLAAYFAGERHGFDLPRAWAGRPQPVQWVPPTAATRCRSCCPATG